MAPGVLGSVPARLTGASCCATCGQGRGGLRGRADSGSQAQSHRPVGSRAAFSCLPSVTQLRECITRAGRPWGAHAWGLALNSQSHSELNGLNQPFVSPVHPWQPVQLFSCPVHTDRLSGPPLPGQTLHLPCRDLCLHHSGLSSLPAACLHVGPDSVIYLGLCKCKSNGTTPLLKILQWLVTIKGLGSLTAQLQHP